MLSSCLYQACGYGGKGGKMINFEPVQQPQLPPRAPPLSNSATAAVEAEASIKSRSKEESEDEDNVLTVTSDKTRIYAAGFSDDGRAPCWTAARLWPGSASTQDILYAGVFDAIGGGADCARAVAALSADYAAVAHLHLPSRHRRRSCSLPQGQSAVLSRWRSRTQSAVDTGCLASSHSASGNASDEQAQLELATHVGGLGLLADRLPTDLLNCHSDAVERLLWDSRSPPASASTVEDRFGWALHQLDADLCGLTVRSARDPCCVPLQAEWARRLVKTGAVGTAVSIETSVLSGQRRLRVAQIGDGASVVGSIGAAGAGWDWRRPVEPHTIENWREVRRLARKFPDPVARAGLFAQNCFLGEQEATRAFGRVGLKWSPDRLAKLAWPSPMPSLPPACLTCEPEVASVTLTPADRLVLLGSPALWQAVEPGEAVACVGDSLLTASAESGGVGRNPASELLRLAQGRLGRDDSDRMNIAAVVIELASTSLNEADESQFEDDVASQNEASEGDGSDFYESEGFLESGFTC